MKIKNILYAASLMALAGINAAEQGGAMAVPGQPAPRADVRVDMPAQRKTAQEVLNRFELLVPAPHAVQKDFLGRMGDRVRSAGTYGYHIGKYPLVACGVCLPFVIKFKDDLFGTFNNSINGLVYGVVGAATVIGIYKGPGDARRQFKHDKIVEEAPLNVRRLGLAAVKIAELENIHGALGQVQANLNSLTEGCQQAVARLKELQEASTRTQSQLDTANDQLHDVVKKQQEAKVLTLIQTLQAAIKDNAAIWRTFMAIEETERNGSNVREHLQVAMAEFAGIQLCQNALIEISAILQDLDPRHQKILATLMENVQPILREQDHLRREIRDISGRLLQLQQKKQGHLDSQKQLALEAAAATASVEVQVTPTLRQQPAQYISLLPRDLRPNVLNSFGIPPVQRPTTPPTVEIEEVGGNKGAGSGNMNDVD